ncbi:MAG: isochorismatase family protein [Nitriliruptorales bacterium]|nr:isochorismatase family protein [Nitriliruptorales bacterium]
MFQLDGLPVTLATGTQEAPVTRALIVVDVQRGFDDPYWGRRDNPSCEANIARLIDAWRDRGDPVVFVRHDSREPGSPLAPGAAGNAFKDVVSGDPDLLVTKSVNSCFYGTPDLDAWLKATDISRLAICGITTNHCCDTTARMAGNLGYDVAFVLDATHTFDRAAADGGLITAEELRRVTGANLHGEFATVVTTDDAVRSAT